MTSSCSTSSKGPITTKPGSLRRCAGGRDCKAEEAGQGGLPNLGDSAWHTVQGVLWVSVGLHWCVRSPGRGFHQEWSLQIWGWVYLRGLALPWHAQPQAPSHARKNSVGHCCHHAYHSLSPSTSAAEQILLGDALGDTLPLQCMQSSGLPETYSTSPNDQATPPPLLILLNGSFGSACPMSDMTMSAPLLAGERDNTEGCCLIQPSVFQ